MATSIIASEYDECEALVTYLDLKGYLYSHVHQEMYTTSPKQKARASALGVRPGVPDYIVVVGNTLVFIEMKSRIGKLSHAQMIWLSALSGIPGVQAKMCRGAGEAIDLLEKIRKSPV